MFHHLFSRIHVSRCYICSIQTVIDSRTITPLQFHFLQNPSSFISRLNSTVSNTNQFTVDYLVNSCGLSPESALKASKRVHLKSPTTTNPDSVISLFKTYGITQPQISILISHNPSLLLANTDKTLKPKLDFFNSIGISGPILGKILSKVTHVLGRSLDKELVPCINFLKGLGLNGNSIAIILNRGGWGIHNAQRKMEPNIAILQHHGVPQSNILKLLVAKARCLSIDSDSFNEVVLHVKKMGVDPSSMVFWRCLTVLVGAKKSKWDEKMAMYRSFGWSDDEVISVFKRHPNIMCISASKINLTLDFFMNVLKWTQGDVAKNPTVILLSLEKRIIPRCHILQILLSKGLISKSGVAYGLLVGEDAFKKYLVKYHHVVPELLKLYQSKMLT